ncbi:uncharacterized protein S101395_02999 [Bacillus sonorensis]|uniref:Knr4/Smi1-like domain-containing protein n=2 Tax=Bacillus sonorensis TaxID=119858 RepID=M5P3Z9_9BACI|nr:SMI1/KNR4 family protein [Bacillus sonorensis]ASB89506.1 uncharacterized protein S101395_02999 [Bacillus sonorensis]EME74183.1 hypothetical protein BSONL12_10356 [Bacillus sonorensis L12]TWK72091.1 hypothetical protein CHCC20335_2787 [Bacillus paralicheniformis]GIN67435.1 hypothetical protein J41TS2_28560 [Bacillus sonorensis]
MNINEGELIKVTLKGLKSIIDTHGTYPLLQPGGFVLEDPYFNFNDPATEEEIEHLESVFKVKFPNDYKEFLRLHNGMDIIDGIEVLSINDVIQYNEVQDLPEGCVLIGYHFDGRYVIDTKRYHIGLDYMFYLDPIDPFEEAEDLGSNFEIWFDRLLSSNGNKFWELNRDIKKYYDNI